MSIGLRSAALALPFCIAVMSYAAEIDESLHGGVKIRNSQSSDGGIVPSEGLHAFVYEGQPRSVRINAKTIGVDYGVSGVLFDRATEEVAKRFTAIEGWPDKRTEDFDAYRAECRNPIALGRESCMSVAT